MPRGPVLLGWWQGAVPWWLGLAALCFAGAVRTSVKEVRRYNQWWAGWQAMGNPAPRGATPKPSVPKRKASSGWAGVVVAFVSVVVIPFFSAAPGTDEALRNGLGLLWLGMALYLVCKLVAKLYRTALRRSRSVSVGAANAGAIAGEAVDVVQWALPPASSSPSRADAVRNLPEYSARLIGRV